MKKIYHLIIFTCLIAFNFSACEKDDNETSISGRWDLQKMKIDVYENNVLKTSQEEIDNLDKLYFVFKPNGKLEMHPEDEPTSEVDFTYKHGVLTLSDPNSGEKAVWPIKFVDSNTFVFSEEETEEENSIIYRIVTELHFKKQ